MTRSPDARALALRALEGVEDRGAYAEAVLDGTLSRHPELKPEDRSLVSQLVYGTLRWRNRLDAHLSRASRRPLTRIHPRLLHLLRLAIYQIVFLDRIPDRAAVHEAVELARRTGLGHAAGFVNAVLRRVAADGSELPLPSDPAAALSLRFGCPAWLVEHWSVQYGPAGAEALCRASARVPPLWLRATPRAGPREEVVTRLQGEGHQVRPGRFAPESILVDSGGDPRRVSLVAEGRAAVQDQASQLIAHLVAPEPGWRILDACAAPGLKATHLGHLGGPKTRVTALEVHPHRARIAEETARHLAPGQIRVEVADARQYRAPEPFDAVLVDAPCSGLGVLARNPEAKWRRRPEDLAGFPPLQLSLLANVAAAVRPGGTLVYATCTTAREENEGVVTAFLATHPEFAREAPPPGPEWHALLTPAGELSTFPGPCTGEGPAAVDGFFGVRLRRRIR